MVKVAIKNENITSFGGIYHIMDVFSKLGFERHGWQATDRSGNDFRHARKRQTLRETTFAMRGNAKPFGKRLSPSAEMPNPSGNDFRQARKCQTFRETTFAKRGNAKPFGKRLSPSAEMPNPLRNDLRASRKSLFKSFDACGPPANHFLKVLTLAGLPQITF